MEIGWPMMPLPTPMQPQKVVPTTPAMSNAHANKDSNNG
jgi:hypothetical protein